MTSDMTIIEGQAVEVGSRGRRSPRRGYVPVEAPQPWERQAGEPARAFRGFTIYRDMDPEDRSLRAAAQELGVHPRQLSDWSSRWAWRERVLDWDREVDRRRTTKRMRDLLAMDDRQANLAILMQSKVLERLKNVKPETLSNRDLDRWLEKATRVERMARHQDSGGLNVNVGVNVSQHQSQAQAQRVPEPVSPARKALESAIAANPASIVDANRTIGDLLRLVDHSTRNYG